MPSGNYQHLKGWKLSKETKRKMKIGSLKRKEKFGYIVSPEARKKISIANTGLNNGMWKGDKVGIDALHGYIKHYLLKPKICSLCHQKGFIELHNINGKYLRNLIDWKWLCRKCHMKIDGRLEKLKERRKNVLNKVPSL